MDVEELERALYNLQAAHVQTGDGAVRCPYLQCVKTIDSVFGECLPIGILNVQYPVTILLSADDLDLSLF